MNGVMRGQGRGGQSAVGMRRKEQQKAQGRIRKLWLEEDAKREK